MNDLKDLSLYDLAMELNDIIRARRSSNITKSDLISINKRWNDVVMELWCRIPSLKEDANVQLVSIDVDKPRKQKLEKKR